MLALDYVVSPTPRLAAINSEPGRIHSEETRRRALDLVDAGMSWAAAGREVGVPKPTIGMWVSARHAAGAPGNGDESEPLRRRP